jgi:hypothetical protein
MLIMVQNMTGPGRPGRENQASLSAMAASGIGWDYPILLEKTLKSASTLYDLRRKVPPEGFEVFDATSYRIRNINGGKKL